MKLQAYHICGAKFSALPLAIVVVCLFGQALNLYFGIFGEFQAALLSVQWMLLVCLAGWCGTFIFLTFSRNDWPLIGLLIIAIFAYFIGYAASWRAADAVILLAGVTLGRGARVLLRQNEEGRMQKNEDTLEIANRKSQIANFLVGLVALLAFASWWHLDMTDNYYRGPRWMGLWDNPNVYGMLMGAGTVLAAGLLTQIMKEECRMQKLLPAAAREDARPTEKVRNSRSLSLRIFLFIAAGMMGVGLFFSYSRGALVGTAVGLLYLAWAYGKLKWRFVLPGIFIAAAVVCVFWHSTADTDAWYLKRLDLSRPSAQHRVSAWRGALQMMRDHPLGVGWNNAVSVYDKNYSPPEGGAAALTMNSYLMLGTELGLPGLICFVAYVGLALKQKSEVRSQESESLQQIVNRKSEIGNRTACRAGAVMLLVAFWFDGGLFDLPTASVFWILLELGAEVGTSRCDVLPSQGFGKAGRTAQRAVPTNNECGVRSAGTDQSLVTSAPTKIQP